MAAPIVTCLADKVESYSASSRTIQLGATATGSPTSWEWTILHVPPGSTANVGTKGNFTNGVASIQNPQLEIDGGVDGGYCIQAVATNGDGSSNPRNQGSQQLIIVQTPGGMTLAPDYSYDWGERYLNPTLRYLENRPPVPFWQWNGTDLSQFTLVDGLNVVSSNAQVLTEPGGRNVIHIESTLVAPDQETGTLLLVNDTPPSRDYVVVADVGGISNSTNGTGLIGTRASLVSGQRYYGYFVWVDCDYGSMFIRVQHPDDTGEIDIYDYDRWFEPQSTRHFDMYRIMIGAEGPPTHLTGWSGHDGDVAVHYKFRAYCLLNPMTATADTYQIEDVGQIAIGVSNGEAIFRDIRAYEIPSDGPLLL